MDIHGYSAHILVNGRKVKEYRHNGLTFIEAKEGTEFAIEVKNHQHSRVLAILSVDGIDVIDGKPATEKSRGYVVNGNNAGTYSGFRKSDTEVGAFQFVTGEKSYATEKGKGKNNGIIAIKLIAEKVSFAISNAFIPDPDVPNKWIKPSYPIFPKQPKYPTFPSFPRPYWEDTLLRDAGTGQADYPTYGGGTHSSAEPRVKTSSALRGRGMSAGATMQAANYCAVVEPTEGSFDMGTTWGSKKVEAVTTTEFEYGNEIGTLEFYYASRESLKAMGVPLITERLIPLPQAFEGAKYAQPPKDWRA